MIGNDGTFRQAWLGQKPQPAYTPLPGDLVQSNTLSGRVPYSGTTLTRIIPKLNPKDTSFVYQPTPLAQLRFKRTPNGTYDNNPDLLNSLRKYFGL